MIIFLIFRLLRNYENKTDEQTQSIKWSASRVNRKQTTLAIVVNAEVPWRWQRSQRSSKGDHYGNRFTKRRGNRVPERKSAIKASNDDADKSTGSQKQQPPRLSTVSHKGSTDRSSLLGGLMAGCLINSPWRRVAAPGASLKSAGRTLVRKLATRVEFLGCTWGLVKKIIIKILSWCFLESKV